MIKKLSKLSTALFVIGLTGCQTSQAINSDQDYSFNDSPTNQSIQVERSTPVEFAPSGYSYEIAATSSSERKALLDILSQIQQMEGLIATAAANQNLDSRVKFRYDWLRQDLYKIDRGISDYLYSPESQPRTLEPIIGDYRR